MSQIIPQERKMEMSTLIGYTNLSNYLYDDYDYSYEMDNRRPIFEGRLLRLIILITVIVLSLIGNILVIVISVFCVRLRSLTSIFILNLALSDLLFTVGLVFWVCELFWLWFCGDAACKVSSFFVSAGFYSSVGFLVLMSVQHYRSVVHPLSGWKKGRWVTHVLICVWMLSILASLPVTVHTIADPYFEHCGYSSDTAFLAITYKEDIVFVCGFLVMAFYYIRILQTIIKSPTNQRHRATTLTFVLAATFFICWAPFNIIKFMYTLNSYSSVMPNYIIYICYHLSYTRCCLNPVIYGLFGLIFRKTARKIFQRRATLTEQVAGGERHSDSYINLNTAV